jgi:GH24 family phage-related lysozyme (muramidase)
MIDFNFISRLEGGRRTRGYVPNPGTSRSGVTVGTGVDLGQMGDQDLDQLDLPDDLKEKLRLYLGKIKYEAVDFLGQYPLVLTAEEAESLDTEVKTRFIQGLVRQFNETADVSFEDLPDGVQTVIASVAFQYGNLYKATPNFWRQITTGDWQGAYRNLQDFGDAYGTRRNQEADLLKRSLEESGMAYL